MFAVANDEMDMIFAEAKQRLSEMTQELEKAENEIHAGRFSYADPALRRLLSLSERFRPMASVLMSRMLRLEKTKY